MRISDWSSDVCSSDLFTHIHSKRSVARHGTENRRWRCSGIRWRMAACSDASRAATKAASPAACSHSRRPHGRSEEHTSELQSLMRISYAVFCLKKKKTQSQHTQHKYQLTKHTI